MDNKYLNYSMISLAVLAVLSVGLWIVIRYVNVRKSRRSNFIHRGFNDRPRYHYDEEDEV